LAKKSDPSTIVSSRRDFPHELPDQPRLAKMESHTATEQQSGCDQSLDQRRAAFNPSGNCQPAPAPDRRIMYPEISPAKSIAFRGEEREHTETNHVWAGFGKRINRQGRRTHGKAL